MKKLLVLLLVATMILGGVGCANDSTEKNDSETTSSQTNTEKDDADSEGTSEEMIEDVEIEFWTMSLSPAFDDYINGVIADFEAQNTNIKVNWTDVPWGDMETKILTAVSSGTAPDTVNLNPQFAAKLATAGALINPETYMTEEEINAYFEAIYMSNAYQGEVFALPWYITNSISIYNTDIYEQAGVEVFTTYDELLEVARTIKEETGKYAYFPTFDGTHFMENVAGSGIAFIKDGQAVFNTPEMVELVQLYATLYQEDLVPGEVFTGGHGKAREMYMSGDIATLISGPTMLGPIKNDALAIYEVTDVENAPTSGSGYSNAAIMNIAVPKQADEDKYEAAVKFSVFMTNAENQLEFCEVAGTILPSTTATLEDDYFKNSDGSVEGKAKMLAAAQLDTSKALIPPMEKLSELNDILIEEVQLAMIGDQTPEEAVKNAEDAWNEVLPEIEHPIDF